jgi:hypothetical protein
MSDVGTLVEVAAEFGVPYDSAFWWARVGIGGRPLPTWRSGRAVLVSRRQFGAYLRRHGRGKSYGQSSESVA